MSFPITGEKVKILYELKTSRKKIQRLKFKDSFIFSADFDDFNANIKFTSYDTHVS